ncbi:MAG: carbohydrate ABC transporter substrate-binding protein, partial [Pannonibacter indicus]
MKKFRHALLATAMCLVMPAAVQAAEMKAEVLHWWTSGGESESIKVFADSFKAKGGEWIDSAIAGGPNARTAGINRIVGGNPPTVMQFNTGLQFDELVATGMLSSLDEVAEANKWR